jgi:phosphoribosylglycinamide formyltransferase-1
MRLISERAVRRFQDRMINIHPSLLPKYPGLDTHARALAAGDREHGASVHVVVPALDAGPVIAQARVPVLAGDSCESLTRRVLEREHPLLIQCVKVISEGTITLSGGQIHWKGRPLRSPLLLNSSDQLGETT